MASITSANAILFLSISSLFNTPQQIQGFAADDIYDIDPLTAAEAIMGVDGVQSAGFVFVPVRQSIALQADSASNAIFDTWWTAQQQVKDVYFANGSITLNSLGRKYTMTSGVLLTYPPAPSARRVLQPRRYVISWQSIIGAPSNNPVTSNI